MAKANDKIGPYILISKLGRGAFGVVWLAEKRTAITTTKVAIKIPNDEDIDLEAIKQEASLWVHASGHPNVLPIIDADIYDEQVIIVSEYAPDGSLSKWLEKHKGKAPSIEAAIEMTLGILAGLEHLHERGIIHRDLKPDNILLQRETPRLADFGIARILKTTSKSTVATGTPAYMPPEAFDGRRSEQTDIWSVGVIFYQLLSGHLPFPQTEFTSLIGAIITREYEPLSDSIPASIKDVIERALKKNQTERFGSASEMRQVLRDTIQHQRPISNRDIKTEVMPRNAADLLPASQSDLTKTPQLQLEYWTAFRDYLERNNSFLNPPQPQAQTWFPITIGRSNFALEAYTQRKGRRICAYLILSGPDAKSHFHLLQRDKEAIHREIGEPLEWRELTKGQQSQVFLCKHKTDPENRQDWEAQHEWLKEKLELFHKVFAARIKSLNASDYAPDIQSEKKEIPRSTVASTAIAPQNPLSPSSFEPEPLLEHSPKTESPVQSTRKSNQMLWVIVSIMALVIIGIVVARKLSPDGAKNATSVVASRLEPTYSVDKERFDSASELFYREQFRAARDEWAHADPARMDARTQFYIAYAFYREGWGRIYPNTGLMKQGLESVNRAIELAPNNTMVVDDPNLQIHTAAELKTELESESNTDFSDLNPLKIYRKRK